MKYLGYLASTVVLSLSIAAALNFCIDPGNIYRDDAPEMSRATALLIDSRGGFWWPDNSVEDRAVKTSLAKYASRFDCVVIGSSHVMQIGADRSESVLGGLCTSVLNLGVSGASIEDHLTMAYLSMEAGVPKKVILGVDPWVFAFGKDRRWTRYAVDYRRALHEIDPTAIDRESSRKGLSIDRLENLLSLEYTIRSLKIAPSIIANGRFQFGGREIGVVDERVGGQYPMLLSNGALIYSASYIERARTTPIPMGGHVYKTAGVINDPDAVKTYRNFLVWMTKRGVKPAFVLTPYHQNVWKVDGSTNVRALRETEALARSLAGQLGISVYGSYNPDSVGCEPVEFYDFMHPSLRCLSKLK